MFPVNPKRQAVQGVAAHRSLHDIPGLIDLAVIATPASTVPGIIRECVELDVKGAIIISAGFAETGEDGRALETEIREAPRVIAANHWPKLPRKHARRVRGSMRLSLLAQPCQEKSAFSVKAEHC